MWQAVLWYVCALFGGIVLATVSGSRIPENKPLWSKLTLGVAGASLLLNGMLWLLVIENALYRDTVTVAILSAACALAVGFAVGSLRTRTVKRRLLVSIAMLFLFSLIVPILVMYAHCTSGDCI